METTTPVDVVFAITGDVRRNSRALRQLRALSGRGYSVVALTIAPAGGQTPDIPNVEFRLIGPPPSEGPSFFLNVHRMISAAAEIIPSRVYHASDLYVLPALARAARRHNAAVTYDARELYPHVASTVGRPWIRYFWRTIEGHYIKRTSAVFTVSESIAEKLMETYRVPRPSVIYNIPEAQVLLPAGAIRERTGLRHEDVVIIHQGQLRPHRGCELLVDAMRDIDSAVLLFLGDGPLKSELVARTREFRITDRVRFADPVPPDVLLSYTSAADVGVTLLEDVCLNHHFALPNKFFEYLVAGIPVVASDLPEVRRIVRSFEVGLVVDPRNRDDLVAALRQASLDKSLREKWRRNIPRALETFSPERQSQEFLRVFDSLVAAKP